MSLPIGAKMQDLFNFVHLIPTEGPHIEFPPFSLYSPANKSFVFHLCNWTNY